MPPHLRHLRHFLFLRLQGPPWEDVEYTRSDAEKAAGIDEFGEFRDLVPFYKIPMLLNGHISNYVDAGLWCAQNIACVISFRHSKSQLFHYPPISLIQMDTCTFVSRYVSRGSGVRAGHHPGPLAHLLEAQTLVHLWLQQIVYALEDIKKADAATLAKYKQMPKHDLPTPLDKECTMEPVMMRADTTMLLYNAAAFD